MHMNRTAFVRWTAILTVIVLILAILAPASAPQPVLAIERTQLRRALLATVRLAVAVDAQRDAYSTGSGTVLTADGYILTNFHVMGDPDTGKLYNRNGIAMVGVNPADLKSLPTWLYQAKLVKGDPALDLAVLKISATFKGGALPTNLGLTPIAIGDSDAVEIGDSIHVIGFPGIGGDSVTYTSGKVAGYLDEDTDRTVDWIKTDAEVNRGNSGGLAVNDAGEMIGVPTAGVSDPEAAGKISLIRPINRAAALIKAAVVQGGGATTVVPGTPTPTTGPRITSLVFSDSVDASDRPGKTSTVFPAGTLRVYAVFQYAGFRDGQEFQGVWYRDGARDVVTTIDWDAGESGSYWISISNRNGIIEGAYELVLSLDGKQLARARMSVGSKAAPTPRAGTFSTPVFAEGVTADDEPIYPHTKNEPFAEGLSTLYAFADYAGMQDGVPWAHVWYVDDEEVLRRQNTWSWGDKGTFWVSISSRTSLPNGQYRLELYIDDALVAQNQTTVGGAGPIFDEDDGVQMTGRILDADTKRPIQGAVFLVLMPGVNVDDFLANGSEDDIYSGGKTDSKGQFVVAELLERGQTYALVAAASGYRSAYMAEYTVSPTAESPIEFDIQLRRSR